MLITLVSAGEKRYTSGMSTSINARARVPSHGVGRIMPWEPGQSGNPNGRPSGLKELRSMCRKLSEPGVKALERILTETVIDESGNVHNAHEGKVIVAAMQIVLTWGWGKPPEYDPKEDGAGIRINTAALSQDQRKILLAALRGGLLTSEDAAAESVEPGTAIEGTATTIADSQ